jgi:hypothetical protein
VCSKWTLLDNHKEDPDDCHSQDDTVRDLLHKSEPGADPTLVRDGILLLAQEPVDAEVTAMVVAERHQRVQAESLNRNRHRDGEPDTRLGSRPADP